MFPPLIPGLFTDIPSRPGPTGSKCPESGGTDREFILESDIPSPHFTHSVGDGARGEWTGMATESSSIAHRTTRGARHFSIAVPTMAAGLASRALGNTGEGWVIRVPIADTTPRMAATELGPVHLVALRKGGRREGFPRAVRAVLADFMEADSLERPSTAALADGTSSSGKVGGSCETKKRFEHVS